MAAKRKKGSAPIHYMKWRTNIAFMNTKMSLNYERTRCWVNATTVKVLKFGTPQTIAIIVLKIEKFDVTLH